MVRRTTLIVGDIDASISFYRDVLGIPLRFETPEWTEFETQGAVLALHRGSESAQSADDSTNAADRAGSCRPGFSVPDLDAFHARMTEHGVRCLQPPKDLFGARIAQYADPDGLVLSVSQSSRGE